MAFYHGQKKENDIGCKIESGKVEWKINDWWDKNGGW
jgi:hypothetical protein